ncbi:MAG: hypothetical protein JNK04_20815 [Myxococcales bacterium]|nr:hypothetical protein [Myxococcales bacterium]
MIVRLLFCAVGSSLFCGCLFLYSVDESDDPSGGAGGSGGDAVGGGGGGILVSQPIGDAAPLLAWTGAQGSALTSEGALWRFTATGEPVRVEGTLSDGVAIAVTRSRDTLVAKGSFEAPAMAVWRCVDDGCGDWITSSPPVALAGLASFGDSVAAVHRDDGRVEIFSDLGESLELLGEAQDEGIAVAARRCEGGDAVAWVAKSAGVPRLFRTKRVSASVGFHEPESLDLPGTAISLTIAADCRVFYLAPGSSGAQLFAWPEGAATGLDVAIESTEDGQVSVGGEQLFVTRHADTGASVGACPLANLGACIESPIACGRVAGIAADPASDDVYFSCDDGLVRWPR